MSHTIHIPRVNLIRPHLQYLISDLWGDDIGGVFIKSEVPGQRLQ